MKNDNLGDNCEKPVLVLLHGYGAGCGIMYKLIKDLASYFHLYVVELLGFGASGRPDFPIKEATESVQAAEDFFLEPLSIFIKEVGLDSRIDRSTGEKRKFYLAGHSFGGYIASVYTLRNYQQIKKLLLLSPIGLPEQPPGFNINDFVDRFDKRAPSIAVKGIYHMWKRYYSPFHVMRWMGAFGTKRFLNMYMSTRLGKVTCPIEAQELSSYLHQIFLRRASGEYGLNSVLQVGAFARNPLIYQLPVLNQFLD